MKMSKFNKAQIAYILRQAKEGTTIAWGDFSTASGIAVESVNSSGDSRRSR